MSYMLTTLSQKREVDSIIRDTIDKVLVLRFGRESDPNCLHLDQILSKAAREVSKFATVALVDVDSPDIQVYVKYFDITLIPSTLFFFNAHHMKMDSGTADHTKWIGAFHKKQDFIDVVERIKLSKPSLPSEKFANSVHFPSFIYNKKQSSETFFSFLSELNG
ncbi:thioredoxin-like protein 4B [Medicago truncatula]|uniref:Thioredoxin-like protein 4B n=1 Tax=Medicago truncatula TaxID=3880 RepID=A0A072VY64_MEDTR|nr:thioredoxin-like protein 4B [Medicago truncatula]